MRKVFTIDRYFPCLFIALLVPLLSHAQTDSINLDSIFKTLNLQEVEVKAKKIRQSNDTVTYNASTYISKDDKVLEDLLRKMPGISVSSDGQISYNGKWISDFYIEGSDLLGGRYTIATTNINADDIATVQVMENHQEAKVLQGRMRGDSPAINIKLKNSAKGAWASTLDSKAGWPLLSRDVSVNLMNFRPRRQNISFYKTNNTGRNLGQEINAPGDMNGDSGTGMQMPAKPSIDDIFSYRNDSHSLSVNQLVETGKNRVLTYNINYLHDRERRHSAEHSVFLVSADSVLDIIEDNMSESKMNYLNGNLNYKINDNGLYLKEALTISAAFNCGNGTVNTDVTQHLDNHSLEIANRITAKKKKDNGSVADYSSTLRMTDKDGKLVLPFICQDIHQSRIHTVNSVSLFSRLVPFVMFGADASAEMKYERVTTGIIQRDNRLENVESAVHLVPRAILHHGSSLQLNLYAPVGVRYYHASDMNMGSYGKVFFSTAPYAFFSYHTQHGMQYDAAVTYGQSLPAATELLTAKYFRNYRTAFANSESAKAGLRHTFKASATVTYKDIIKMLFSSLAVTYAVINSPNTEAYRFSGNEIDYYLHPDGNLSKTISVDQSFSKGFLRYNSKIQQSLTLGRYDNEYIIEGARHRGRTNVFRAMLGYSANPSGWMALSSVFSYILSQPYTDGRRGDTLYRTLGNSTSLVLWAGKSISFNTQAKYYYNNYFSENRNNLYVNEYVEYHLKRTIISLECLNIFNTKQFRTVTDKGVTRFNGEYQLRGRTVMVGIRVKIL